MTLQIIKAQEEQTQRMRSKIPDPPVDSVEESFLAIRDKVYFFAHGIAAPKFSEILMRGCALRTLLSGKWRKGEVRDQEGSSVDSPRYLVRYSGSYVDIDCFVLLSQIFFLWWVRRLLR